MKNSIGRAHPVTRKTRSLRNPRPGRAAGPERTPNRGISSKRIQAFRRALLGWYAKNGRALSWRRKSASLYYKIVAEVLLQRTTVATVERFLPNFVRSYPSWESLSKESPAKLSEVLKPLGLYRLRSTAIARLSIQMVSNRGRFPKDREGIDRLPGVGQYIANSIELFAHRRPLPLLDVNMARVLERYFGPRRLADIRYDPYLQDLAARVVSADRPERVNWAILDFAAGVCRARNPRCSVCPLKLRCLYYRNQRTN